MLELAAVVYALRAGLSWMWAHKRAAGELVLALALLVGGWMYNRKTAELRQAAAERAQLADGLRGQITLRDGQIEILRRENGEIIASHQYIPPEGSVVITQKDMRTMRERINELTNLMAHAASPAEFKKLQAELDNLRAKLAESDVVIIVKDRGITLKPGYALDWSNHGIKPGLDFKLYYLGRYSAIIGGSENGVGPRISRHLDDVLWGRPRNVEFFIGYNFFRFQSADAAPIIGIRSNF